MQELDHSPAPTLAPDKTLTVGVFDSGAGGFTVARAILARRPELNLVYFGDNLNLPYGGRSHEQLHNLSHGNIEFLIHQGADLIAVGCQTSNSVLGVEELESYGVPTFDLVGSTIDWLHSQGELPQKLGLLATAGTVRAGYWQRMLGQSLPQLELRAVACPLLVPLIESAQPEHHALRKALEGYLVPLLESGVGDVILGCTHYPLILDYIYEIDRGLRCIDPAECLALRLDASLPPAAPGAARGERRFYSSLPGERFYQLGERVFGHEIRNQTRMFIVNPCED